MSAQLPEVTPIWIQVIFDESNGYIPNTKTNETALLAWAASESPGTLLRDCLNPLACGDAPGGSTVCYRTTDLAIPLYRSLTTMADVYLHAWQTDPYTEIGKALHQGTNLHRIWKAINDSPWCGGYHVPGQNSCDHIVNGRWERYPARLYDLLHDKAETSDKTPVAKGGGAVYTPAAKPAPLSRDMRRHWNELMHQLHVIYPEQLHKAIRYRVIMKNSVLPYKTRKSR